MDLKFQNKKLLKNRYKLLEKTLIKGGMSETYFSEDLKSGKEVVIKFFKGASYKEKSRFIREIRILKKYKNSGFIIPILDFDDCCECPFFVMPRASCDLLELDKLSTQDSKRYFYRMLECLEFIHNNQAFHRDIKPTNFLIYKGTVICSDFGLAKDLQLTQFTKSGEFGGTECYMPPEFRTEHGFQNPQRSSDIYSLGKTFYFLLTKKIPAYTEQGVIPHILYKVIEKAINENPGQRYQSCYEFKNALRKAYVMIDQQTNILFIKPNIKKKNLESSIKNYNNLINKNPDNFIAYYNRGLNKHDLDRYEEAIEDYSKVIKLNPNFFIVYNNRGNARCELGQYKEAMVDYNKAIELNPKAVLAYYNRGSIKHISGKYKEAMEDYNKAIELNPHYSEAYNSRGGINHTFKKYKEAIKDYNKAIKLNPSYTEAYNNLGLIKTDMRKYRKAIKYYNKSIQLNPHFSTYYALGLAKSGLAQLFYKNNFLEKTKKILFFFNSFYSESLSKKYEEAIKDFNEAIRLNPNYAEAYNDRGVAKYDLGKYSESIEDYNRAIQLNSSFFGAYSNRGLVKVKIGKYKEAIEDYNEAIKLNPDYAGAYYNRGLAKIKLNQHNEAIFDFEKAVELDFELESQLRSEINKLKNCSLNSDNKIKKYNRDMFL